MMEMITPNWLAECVSVEVRFFTIANLQSLWGLREQVSGKSSRQADARRAEITMEVAESKGDESSATLVPGKIGRASCRERV